jgi:hypothetical protein
MAAQRQNPAYRSAKEKPRFGGASLCSRLAHTERSRLPPIQAPRARIAPRRGLLVLVVCLALIPASAQAATTHVDGISDQSLPAWNGSFADSSFASFFRANWGEQIAFARYVVQWNTMAEASSGANPDGDYRERFEAWLEDVRGLGLTPVLALTSYNGVYPSAPGEYQRELEQLLTQADRLQAPVAYVEAWNEPNNQGNEPAARAGEIADWADAVCDQRACQLIAGDFEDAPSLPSYEHEYIGALSFSPAIWGIHPYRSVKAHSDVPVVRFEQALPDHGADTQLWFTEIGAYYCLHGQVLGALFAALAGCVAGRAGNDRRAGDRERSAELGILAGVRGGELRRLCERTSPTRGGLHEHVRGAFFGREAPVFGRDALVIGRADHDGVV